MCRYWCMVCWFARNSIVTVCLCIYFTYDPCVCPAPLNVYLFTDLLKSQFQVSDISVDQTTMSTVRERLRDVLSC